MIKGSKQFEKMEIYSKMVWNTRLYFIYLYLNKHTISV